MKIGLDVHGVIDKYPKIFRDLSINWDKAGHEVHILTGQSGDIVIPTLKKLKIVYHHFYSILDLHRKQGTKMWDNDKRGAGWWMDKNVWACSKGRYASEVGLNCHFDDSYEYGRYFPGNCSFILVKIGFDKVMEL